MRNRIYEALKKLTNSQLMLLAKDKILTKKECIGVIESLDPIILYVSAYHMSSGRVVRFIFSIAVCRKKVPNGHSVQTCLFIEQQAVANELVSRDKYIPMKKSELLKYFSIYYWIRLKDVISYMFYLIA